MMANVNPKLFEPVSADLRGGTDPSQLPSGPRLLRKNLLERQFDPDGREEKNGLGEHAKNWKDCRDKCEKLLLDSKDLELLWLFAVAQLRTNGISAFTEALALLRRTCEDFWDDCYPARDPEDPRQTRRFNLICNWHEEGFGARALDSIFLFEDKRQERIPLIDVRMAGGSVASAPSDFLRARMPVDLYSPDYKAPEPYVARPPADLKAIYSEGGAAAVEVLLADLPKLKEEFDRFHAALSAPDRLGPDAARAFKTWTDQIDLIMQEVRAFFGVGAAAPTTTAAAGSAQVPGAAQSAPGSLTSRDDVLALLDRIIDHYRRTEPSSPVPLLLAEVRSLVGMPFMDVLDRLHPGGTKDVRLSLSQKNE